MENIETYYELRNKIDSLAARLEEMHHNHLSCKMGCDLCCMDYSIFPIEFYSIKKALKNKNIQLNIADKTDNSSCVFLKDHKCTIYNERPIICRTHGLPLLYMNEESEWELSACELNFTNFDMGEFTNENTFPQDKFNSELFLLNKKFISKFTEKEYGEFDLIPIRELAEISENK